jgi:hypothetical protein
MKTMNVGAIGGDYEDQDLQRQIAMAQALRAKSLETPGEMVGGWYVGKNPLLNLGEAAIGHINERGAVGRQGEIQQGRDVARQELLGAMPTPTMEQELSGPATEAGVGPGMATVQKPYEQQAQDWNQWSAKAAALRGDPMAQQLAMSGLTQAMSMPEKKLAAETKMEEARQARLEKALAAKEAAATKAEEQRIRDKEQYERQKELRILTKTLGGQNADIQRELLKARLEKLKEPTATEVKAAAAKEEKAASKQGLSDSLAGAAGLVNKIYEEGGMPSTEDNPVSNLWASRFRLPGGQIAGQAVGTKAQAARDELKSQRLQILNDIKKATGMSSQQLNSNVELKTWLDSLGAPEITKEGNLNILKNIQEKYIDGGKPAAAGYDADKEARYQAWKASQAK